MQNSHRFIVFTKRRGDGSRTLFLRLGSLIQSCGRRFDVLKMAGFIWDLVRGFAKSTVTKSVAVKRKRRKKKSDRKLKIG